MLKKQENLENDLRRSQDTLVLFEKEKSELENKLYSKFLPVLNAKKDEIIRLKNLKSVPEEMPDYGSDTDVDTDDENNFNGTKRQKCD